MPLNFFFSWRPRRRSNRLNQLQVVLYTRRGCHLCEIAWEKLRVQQNRYGFTLNIVDVDEDPELAARYGQEVPVVTVDGRVRFRGGVNQVLLDRLLRAAAQQ